MHYRSGLFSILVAILLTLGMCMSAWATGMDAVMGDGAAHDAYMSMNFGAYESCGSSDSGGYSAESPGYVGSSGGWQPVSVSPPAAVQNWNSIVNDLHVGLQEHLANPVTTSANPISNSANPIMAFQTLFGDGSMDGQYGAMYLNVVFKNGIPAATAGVSVTVYDTAGSVLYTQPIQDHVRINDSTISIDQYAIFSNEKDRGIASVGAVVLTFYDANGQALLTSDAININPIGEGFGVRMGLPSSIDRAGFGPAGTGFEYGYAYYRPSPAASVAQTSVDTASKAEAAVTQDDLSTGVSQ